MRKELLNVAWLNGAMPIKNGSSSGGSTGGATKPRWTGHADVEGLKAIGWDDEDIAYYQEHGVNWNEEDDQYHKVPEDNIALYGVLTVYNISIYKDRIVYLPKIDTSSVTSMRYMFQECYSLISIPKLDTSSVTSMDGMFHYCYSLISIPQLDTSSVTSMNGMFNYCYSLISIPQLDTSSVTNMSNMFYVCDSLISIPQLDTSSVTSMRYMFQECYSLISIPKLDTSSVTSMDGMFYKCTSLISIPQLDTSSVTSMSNMFHSCYSLQAPRIKNLKSVLDVQGTSLLTKESLLYIINNESATSAITIKLRSYTYDKYVNDADIVAALANHPNISIAK